MHWIARVAVVVLVGAACAPQSAAPDAGVGTDGDDDTDARPPIGPAGSVSGTVWMPGNAPGMVPDGQEIPVAGAVVYVTSSSPPPIPDEAYCDPCQDNPPGAVITDAAGAFSLGAVSAGSHRLVIEKAQFRLEQTIEVNSELGLSLPAERTTLPARHDPANGKWVPRIALAIGDSDQVEDIFAKMGMVDVDSTGRAVEASFANNDRLDLYGNPIAPPFPSQHVGTIDDLFRDLDRMLGYHIIFVPCNYESSVASLSQPAVRENIRAYVAAGGKLYTTDWSAEWEDAAFPEFIAFDPTHDTTKAQADANVINLGDGDFGHFAMHASVEDPDMASWLDGQRGPLVIPLGGEEMDFPSEYADGVIDASDFVIEGSWNMIRSLPAVTIGTDGDGNPIVETATEWISGDYQTGRSPHTVTFEPSCGRVLYSTYHTAQQTHRGLVPQERVLLYLIMEIGVCNDGPIIP